MNLPRAEQAAIFALIDEGVKQKNREKGRLRRLSARRARR